MGIDKTTYSFQQNELSGNDQANVQKMRKDCVQAEFLKGD